MDSSSTEKDGLWILQAVCALEKISTALSDEQLIPFVEDVNNAHNFSAKNHQNGDKYNGFGHSKYEYSSFKNDDDDSQDSCAENHIHEEDSFLSKHDRKSQSLNNFTSTSRTRHGVVEGVWNNCFKRRSWSSEEDEKLTELVKQHGAENWPHISSLMEGRGRKTCRERWFTHLCSEVKKSRFTEEEDILILSAQHKYGNRWAVISKLLPGRTGNAIKNQFHGILRRKDDEGKYKGRFIHVIDSYPPLILKGEEDDGETEPASGYDKESNGGGSGGATSKKIIKKEGIVVGHVQNNHSNLYGTTEKELEYNTLKRGKKRSVAEAKHVQEPESMSTETSKFIKTARSLLHYDIGNVVGPIDMSTPMPSVIKGPAPYPVAGGGNPSSDRVMVLDGDNIADSKYLLNPEPHANISNAHRYLQQRQQNQQQQQQQQQQKQQQKQQQHGYANSHVHPSYLTAQSVSLSGTIKSEPGSNATQHSKNKVATQCEPANPYQQQPFAYQPYSYPQYSGFPQHGGYAQSLSLPPVTVNVGDRTYLYELVPRGSIVSAPQQQQQQQPQQHNDSGGVSRMSTSNQIKCDDISASEASVPRASNAPEGAMNYYNLPYAMPHSQLSSRPLLQQQAHLHQKRHEHRSAVVAEKRQKTGAVIPSSHLSDNAYNFNAVNQAYGGAVFDGESHAIENQTLSSPQTLSSYHSPYMTHSNSELSGHKNMGGQHRDGFMNSLTQNQQAAQQAYIAQLQHQHSSQPPPTYQQPHHHPYYQNNPYHLANPYSQQVPGALFGVGTHSMKYNSSSALTAATAPPLPMFVAHNHDNNSYEYRRQLYASYVPPEHQSVDNDSSNNSNGSSAGSTGDGSYVSQYVEIKKEA